jgi:hypothetical protein
MMNKLAMIIVTVLLAMALNIFCSQAFAAVYYVKNNGNDKASGLSDSNAWKTIAKVNAFARDPGFSDGDIIQFKRGDIWTNDETLGHSGQDVNWGGVNGLIFRDYGSGPKPRFNANTQQPIRIQSNTISNVTIKNIDCSGMDYTDGRSHIELSNFSGAIVDGIEIDGHIEAKIFNRPYAFIEFSEIDGDIEVKNCILQNAVKKTWQDTVNSWGEKDAYLVAVQYDDKDVPKSKGRITIRDNILHDTYADCIYLNGIRTETFIYNNVLTNFGENAIDLKAVRYCDIFNNKMSRGGYGTGGSGGGKGVIGLHDASNIPGDTEDIKIHGNYIYDSDFFGVRLLFICKNVEVYGNTFKSVRTPISVQRSSGSRIHNNIIIVDKGYGVSGNDAAAIRVRKGEQNDIKITNNSIFMSSPDHRYGIRYEPRSGRKGTEISKNIIQMNRKSQSVFPLYVTDEPGDDPKVTDNCFYNPNHSNRVYWKGKIYDATSQSGWRSKTQASGTFADPKFVNPEEDNLKLADSSPCSQWGADLKAIHFLPEATMSMGAPHNLRIRQHN